MKQIIKDHYHDEEQEVYRVVINVIQEEPVEVPVLDNDDNQVLDDDDKPLVNIEIREQVVHEFDILFSADDEQWKGQTPEHIANEQRRQIKEAMEAVESQHMEAVRRQAEFTQMPGIGEEL